MPCNVIDQHFDQQGRYCILIIEIYDNIYTLVNVYAPNDKKSRNKFYKTIQKQLENVKQGILIIGGDHNDTLGIMDRVTSSNNNRKQMTVPYLSQLIKIHNLTDIWRYKFKNKQQFTWRRKHSIEKSRIDFWLTDWDIITQIFSCDIRPAAIESTDHMAISIKIKIPCKRGPGYWKFNNTLLNNLLYTKQVEIILNNFKYLQVDHKCKWELCKIEIKQFTINFSKELSRQRNVELQNLEKQLHNLYKELDTNSNQCIQHKIEQLEIKIKLLYDIKLSGAKIRSRVKLIDENEKNTKYFHNLEKNATM